jgi:hypothetical protein
VSIFFNDLVSGNGTADFSGNQVQYILVHLETIGPDVFIQDPTNVDVYIRAGWLSLGVDETYPDEVRRVFWTDRIWLNFADMEWHPRPSNHPSDPPDFTVYASHLRWALSPGTSANVLVVGI